MKRRGFTLLELLIAILIMLAITAVTIPVVAPALSGRQVREAARMVDVFISGAKSRAQRTGRPVGVSFELTPVNATAWACRTLKYAEVPPSYNGDFTGSTILITSGKGWLGGFPSSDVGWVSRVRPGDLIQFGYQSRFYRLYAGEPYVDLNANGAWDAGEPFVDLDLNGAWTAPQPGVVSPDGYFASPPNATNPDWTFAPADDAEAISEMLSGGSAYSASGVARAFQITVGPTMLPGSILTLPDATVIDMGWADTSGAAPVIYPGSGVEARSPLLPPIAPGPGLDEKDGATFLPNLGSSMRPSAARIVMTFGPSGTVDRVYSFVWNGNPAAPGWLPWAGRQGTSAIYFLVGDIKKVGGDHLATAGQPKFNFQDAGSLIVAVNPLSGSLSVAHNVAPDLSASIQRQLLLSRSLAREAVQMESR